MFGWMGGTALQSGASLTVATAIGFGSGFIVMVATAWLIRMIYSMRTDGTPRIIGAIGAVGSVDVTLPPGRAPGGQIGVTVSGRVETLAAHNAALRAIPNGEKVKVAGVIDTNTVLVIFLTP